MMPFIIILFYFNEKIISLEESIVGIPCKYWPCIVNQILK